MDILLTQELGSVRRYVDAVGVSQDLDRVFACWTILWLIGCGETPGDHLSSLLASAVCLEPVVGQGSRGWRATDVRSADEDYSHSWMRAVGDVCFGLVDLPTYTEIWLLPWGGWQEDHMGR